MSNFKGKVLSANLPYLVKFKTAIGGADVKFQAHLVGWKVDSHMQHASDACVHEWSGPDDKLMLLLSRARRRSQLLEPRTNCCGDYLMRIVGVLKDMMVYRWNVHGSYW